MPAYYTVVQCVPDPIADERINVGVIVFGDGQIRSRFVKNWQRVARFVGENVSYVREFAERVEKAALESAAGVTQSTIPGFPGSRRLDEATLRSMIGNWSNSIQFTPAQPSLESPEELLATAAELFLRETTGNSPRFRDRQAAARIAVREVREAVTELVGAGEAEHLVQPAYQLAGRLLPRLRVDLAIKNGRVYEATRALSFETHDMAELDQQIQRTLFILKDVGDRHEGVLLDLLALPPHADLRGFRESRQRFREVEASCRQLSVRLVLEHDASDWAAEVAQLVETEIVRPSRTASRG